MRGNATVTSSNLVTVDANMPQHGHLALTGDPSQMRYELCL